MLCINKSVHTCKNVFTFLFISITYGLLQLVFIFICIFYLLLHNISLDDFISKLRSSKLSIIIVYS